MWRGTRSQSSSSAIREASCSLVNRLSLIIRTCGRSSGGTICIASSRLSNSMIIQPQCTPASQPQSACVTKCEPNCSIARSALSQVSYSRSSWCSSIMYRGMRGSLSLRCRRQNSSTRAPGPEFSRRSIPESTPARAAIGDIEGISIGSQSRVGGDDAATPTGSTSNMGRAGSGGQRNSVVID